jgi:peptidyl-prolyl cis-trans isomerase SurA
MQGLVKGSNKAKCEILENLLFQKLLLNQAELDSIVVSDEMVERNMEQRISYFVQQIGSEEKLEEYYNKSISQLKEEFRDLIKEQMLVDQAQSSITADVTVTPSEVKKFYESIPSDSIPEVGTQYEISQIVIDPPIGPKEIMETREKLNSMRTRIVNGESFSTLAILYSEDPGSAAKGGELGFHRRGDFYPEFEAVAFNLKKGQISEIVKTEAGFHIIELMEQRGESFNFRHILIQPKVNIEDIQAAIDELDSLTVIINKGDITFEEAAAKNSDDKNKDNGGLLVNPMTSTTMWGDDQLDQNMKFTIMRMKEGDISKPIEMVTDKNKKAYRIIKLNKRIAPHKANMEQDYNQIKDWATEEKKGRVIQDWINTKTKDTYVRILDSFSDCDFEHTWTK